MRIRREVIVNGKVVSLNFEPEVWDVLNTISQREKTSLSFLLGKVEDLRGGFSLEYAIRSFVTGYCENLLEFYSKYAQEKKAMEEASSNM